MIALLGRFEIFLNSKLICFPSSGSSVVSMIILPVSPTINMEFANP